MNAQKQFALLMVLAFLFQRSLRGNAYHTGFHTKSVRTGQKQHSCLLQAGKSVNLVCKDAKRFICIVKIGKKKGKLKKKYGRENPPDNPAMISDSRKAERYLS